MNLGGEENADGIRRRRSITYRMMSESLAGKGERGGGAQVKGKRRRDPPASRTKDLTQVL
jgi:hypothetical protein